MKTNAFYGKMTVQCCDNCMNRRTDCDWAEGFKGGWTRDDACSGHKSSSHARKLCKNM